MFSEKECYEIAIKELVILKGRRKIKKVLRKKKVQGEDRLKLQRKLSIKLIGIPYEDIEGVLSDIKLMKAIIKSTLIMSRGLSVIDFDKLNK